MQLKSSIALPELRRKLRDRVNESRDQRMSGGCLFDGHVYDTDEKAIVSIALRLAALGAGIPLPRDFTWRSARNVDVPHNPQSFRALASAILDYQAAIHARARAIKDAIDASPNPAAVDVKTGWPDP